MPTIYVIETIMALNSIPVEITNHDNEVSVNHPWDTGQIDLMEMVLLSRAYVELSASFELSVANHILNILPNANYLSYSISHF